MAGETIATQDHEEIKTWVEERGGHPASVKGTSEGGGGLLRVNFPGYGKEGSLEDISWEEFFKKFDEKNLTFLYQDKTRAGQESRFFKFVSKATVAHTGR